MPADLVRRGHGAVEVPMHFAKMAALTYHMAGRGETPAKTPAPAEATSSDKADMLQLRAQAQRWIDSLQISGMNEDAIVSAIHLSLVERVLVRGGVVQTAKWLRSMASMVETQGSQLLAELRRQGH
jgi:hypothetical protein